MTKEMIVSSNDHETAVAILEDDQLVEVFIERERNRGVVGNVYKGRVSKVLPGMQSAFVDLGLERDGFLYVTDVVNTQELFDKLESGDEDDTAETTAEAVTAALTAASESAEAQVATPVAAPPAAPPLTSGERTSGDKDRDRGTREAKGGESKGSESPDRLGIEDLLKEGQEVLVQVAKEPLGTKGARITSQVSIPGRFLVFMPTVDHVGVSRKIESREERARLRGIIRQFRETHGFTGGLIIRTAAAGRPDADIIGDLNDFLQIWNEIRQKMENSRAPAVIYREQSLVSKLMRDLLTDEYQTIRIDSLSEYRKVQQLLERILPQMLPRVKLYTRNYPIFDEYGIRGEIEKALRSKVWLKSGGYLVINQAEALVAVDVNTGRYVGKRTGRLEDTIVKTNLEATKEIARQLRLRDLGGIIVLDFIDMEERKNRQKVLQALEQELKRDRSPSKAVQVSEFGLIIVTRKRVKQSLERLMTEPCPYCSGTGTVKSTATICFDILTEMKKLSAELNGHGVLLRVNPDIAKALKEGESAVLRDVERAVGRRVTIKPDPALHHEQFDVMAV
jgi:Rne/Rng family ribonuclease